MALLFPNTTKANVERVTRNTSWHCIHNSKGRETVCRPHLNQELKDHIAKCPTSEKYHDKLPKEPRFLREVPNRAWTKFIFEFKSHVSHADYYSSTFLRSWPSGELNFADSDERTDTLLARNSRNSFARTDSNTSQLAVLSPTQR